MPAPLPTQPQTLAALQAMQSLIAQECLIAGTSPFATLNASDAARYGVGVAVFIGRPKDFADASLPQCQIWLPSETEQLQVASYTGRAESEWEARITILVDRRADWFSAEQQVLAIRDALWPVLLRHQRLGGTVPSVMESAAWPGRGLCFEQIAGSVYRCYEAVWWVRQQWSISGGVVL